MLLPRLCNAIRITLRDPAQLKQMFEITFTHRLALLDRYSVLGSQISIEIIIWGLLMVNVFRRIIKQIYNGLSDFRLKEIWKLRISPYYTLFFFNHTP